SIKVGEGIAGKALKNRQKVSVENLEYAGPEFKSAELLKEENFKAMHVVPLVAKGQVKGVMEVYHRHPFQADQEWMSFFETLAGQAAIAIDNADMFDNLQQTNLELMLAYDKTLEGWITVLDLRDHETE